MNVRTFTRLALRSPAMATVLGLATLRPTMLQRLAITSAVLAATALALPASATVVAVSRVNTVGNYYGLNAVGARFWQCASDGRPLPEICEMLVHEYEVPRDQLSFTFTSRNSIGAVS